MADSVDEPDQINIDIPPDYRNRIESKNAYIWYISGYLEYILLFISIAIILIFLIPFDNKYYIWIYIISIVSYALVIFFVYFWSRKRDMRDVRLMLIFFVFAMLASQFFHYYTLNNVVVVSMYTISLILLLYISIRGWKTVFAIAMLFPIAFIIYQIVVQIMEWIYGKTSLPN